MVKKPPVNAEDFAALRLPDALLEVISELGYTQPTRIQAESIPPILSGRDLIGQSRTGSGKTAAFALPVLAKIQIRKRCLQTMILCPTRELCAQVAREIRKLGRRHPGLTVIELAGGQPIRQQIFALDKGVHIAVGTPGRLLDHLNRGTLNPAEIRTIVLDEADRMLDMGFREDMEQILGATPSGRQTILFSATFPDSIEQVSRDFQHKPVRIVIDTEEQKSPPIKQYVCRSEPADKVSVLLSILTTVKPQSSIVFCNLKAAVADVVKALADAGFSAGGLHGDLEQFERDRMMAKFRNKSIRVLVATDVAARGIDVEALDLVVNFDLPKPETYVHRIGRSGRAGNTGLAVSLATSREAFRIEAIEALTEVTIEPCAPDQLPGPAQNATEIEAAMVTLMIGGGRKDKLRPGDILGALTGEAGGLQAAQIGKIEIHDRFAYVAVAAAVAGTVLSKLKEGRIKGRNFSVSLVS